MEAVEHLRDGFLPGWPGRTRFYLTSGGTQILHFQPSEEDEILEIGRGRTVLLKREEHCNALTGTKELGWNYGDLSNFYPDFVYIIVGDAQKRVTACLRGEK